MLVIVPSNDQVFENAVAANFKHAVRLSARPGETILDTAFLNDIGLFFPANYPAHIGKEKPTYGEKITIGRGLAELAGSMPFSIPFFTTGVPIFNEDFHEDEATEYKINLHLFTVNFLSFLDFVCAAAVKDAVAVVLVRPYRDKQGNKDKYYNGSFKDNNDNEVVPAFWGLNNTTPNTVLADALIEWFRFLIRVEKGELKDDEQLNPWQTAISKAWKAGMELSVESLKGMLLLSAQYNRNLDYQSQFSALYKELGLVGDPLWYAKCLYPVNSAKSANAQNTTSAVTRMLAEAAAANPVSQMSETNKKPDEADAAPKDNDLCLDDLKKALPVPQFKLVERGASTGEKDTLFEEDDDAHVTDMGLSLGIG